VLLRLSYVCSLIPVPSHRKMATSFHDQTAVVQGVLPLTLTSPNASPRRSESRFAPSRCEFFNILLD
jgi:hypothetical protein